MDQSPLKEHPPIVVEAARMIKLIAFDVDGVLTDGMISYTSSGEEVKSFNVRDGHAIKMASRGGLSFAVITGRESPMVTRRCDELGIELLYQNSKDKYESFQNIIERTGFSAREIAYMGDDVVDLPVITAAGLGCCPSDAAEEVRVRSNLITAASSGNGAARELIFFILRVQGLLKGLMARYTSV